MDEGAVRLAAMAKEDAKRQQRESEMEEDYMSSKKKRYGKSTPKKVDFPSERRVTRQRK